jgi:hypothetical protein
MSDKILINIIYLTLGAILVGLIGIATDQKNMYILFDFGSALFVITGGYLIVKIGRFIKTTYFRLLGIGVSVIILGALFKIMHWPYTYLMLACGYCWIIILYLIYQLNNKNRRWIDWLKVLCLTMLLTSKYFKTAHWPYNDELYIISVLLLGVIVIEYTRRNFKISDL